MTTVYKFIFMLILGIGLSLLFFRFCIVTHDVSLPQYIWFKLGSKDVYKKYSYVLVKVDDEKLQDTLIVKQIVCIAGDEIIKINNEIFCNGKEKQEHIGKVLETDKNGNPLKQFMRNERLIISDGMYFLAGSHERSYDSRYFGLVAKENIIIEVYPIL